MDMINSEDISHIFTIIGTGAATIASMFYLFSSAKTKTALDDSTITATEAQGSVIELLQKQVERMSQSNEELGIALKQFQCENMALRKEISDLHITINTLSEKINKLSHRNLQK